MGTLGFVCKRIFILNDHNTLIPFKIIPDPSPRVETCMDPVSNPFKNRNQIQVPNPIIYRNHLLVPNPFIFR